MQWLEPGLHCNHHKLEVSTLHETPQKESTPVTHILLFRKTLVMCCRLLGKGVNISMTIIHYERKTDPAASLVQLLDGVILTLILLIVQHIAGDRHTTCPVQPAPRDVLCR